MRDGYSISKESLLVPGRWSNCVTICSILNDVPAWIAGR